MSEGLLRERSDDLYLVAPESVVILVNKLAPTNYVIYIYTVVV